MPSPTYTPLANITLGSSAATVVFSSINQGYRDLVFSCNLQASATNGVKIRVNSLTGSIYYSVSMYGDGSTAGSYLPSNPDTTLGIDSVSATSGIFTPVQVQIMDYSATDKHHPVLARVSNSSVSPGVTAVAGRIADTSAITSVTFMFATAATFAAGSSFALYGIAS